MKIIDRILWALSSIYLTIYSGFTGVSLYKVIIDYFTYTFIYSSAMFIIAITMFWLTYKCWVITVIGKLN